MVEFGEQLRRAREAKGMTQQSLAEQLFVTRQAVSRWECGDRYPDLLTTKKISFILDVSIDNLLSGNEMKKVVERNPVIEKPYVNNIMIALYAIIVLSFIVTVVDIIARFPINSDAIAFSDIQVVIINLIGLIIQIVIFIYGLINAWKGMLSPKRMGVIISVFFASICLADSNHVFGSATRQLIFTSVLLVVPSILGAVTSYMYFIWKKVSGIYPILIYAASVWNIIRMAINFYMIVRETGQVVSMNTTLGILLKASIYILIMYQTYTLEQKRKMVLVA
ncbi:MAG: helix-turn-helix transcriptional regulator [Lachnospiraceae bacterium]|nr:helix-turn-helix transcriptional regulator [Lachnospiraceae bacterium]